MLWKKEPVSGDLAQAVERDAAGIMVPLTGPVMKNSLFCGPRGSILAGISS